MQGECRAELARAMLSRSLHSPLLLVCNGKDTKKINTFPENPRLRINLKQIQASQGDRHTVRFNLTACLSPCEAYQSLGALAHHPLQTALAHVEHIVAVAADAPARARRIQLEALLRHILLTVFANHLSNH